MRTSSHKVAFISKISNPASVTPPASCCHWCEWCQGHLKGDLKDVNMYGSKAKQSKAKYLSAPWGFSTAEQLFTLAVTVSKVFSLGHGILKATKLYETRIMIN